MTKWKLAEVPIEKLQESELNDGELEEVSGQGCGTGAEYAAKELLMD